MTTNKKPPPNKKVKGFPAPAVPVYAYSKLQLKAKQRAVILSKKLIKLQHQDGRFAQANIIQQSQAITDLLYFSRYRGYVSYIYTDVLLHEQDNAAFLGGEWLLKQIKFSAKKSIAWLPASNVNKKLQQTAYALLAFSSIIRYQSQQTNRPESVRKLNADRRFFDTGEALAQYLFKHRSKAGLWKNSDIAAIIIYALFSWIDTAKVAWAFHAGLKFNDKASYKNQEKLFDSLYYYLKNNPRQTNLTSPLTIATMTNVNTKQYKFFLKTLCRRSKLNVDLLQSLRLWKFFGDFWSDKYVNEVRRLTKTINAQIKPILKKPCSKLSSLLNDIPLLTHYAQFYANNQLQCALHKTKREKK